MGKQEQKTRHGRTYMIQGDSKVYDTFSPLVPFNDMGVFKMVMWVVVDNECG